jgi:hypothetical protein
MSEKFINCHNRSRSQLVLRNSKQFNIVNDTTSSVCSDNASSGSQIRDFFAINNASPFNAEALNQAEIMRPAEPLKMVDVNPR